VPGTFVVNIGKGASLIQIPNQVSANSPHHLLFLAPTELVAPESVTQGLAHSVCYGNGTKSNYFLFGRFTCDKLERGSAVLATAHPSSGLRLYAPTSRGKKNVIIETVM